MLCPECHTELDKNERYCKNCGKEQKKKRRISKKKLSSINTSKIIKKNKKKKEEKEIKNKNHPKDDSIVLTTSSNEDLINAYIGPNADWLKNQNFSILTAFFGPFYLLCRKLWLQALILIVIYIFSHLYLQENIGMLLRVILNILTAAKFKDIYKKEVKNRVEYIEKQNKGKSSEEIMDICKIQGGLLPLIIVIMVFVFYVISIGILLNQERYTAEPEKEETTRRTINEMNYEITKTMIQKDAYLNYQYYVDHKEHGACYTMISSTKTTETTKEYLLDVTSIYDTYVEKEIKEFALFGKNGHFFTMTTGTTKKEIYVVKHNDRIYEIKWEDTNYKKENCKEDKEFLINSISWN